MGLPREQGVRGWAEEWGRRSKTRSWLFISFLHFFLFLLLPSLSLSILASLSLSLSECYGIRNFPLLAVVYCVLMWGEGAGGFRRKCRWSQQRKILVKLRYCWFEGMKERMKME
jgi:hypothetical protein